MLVILGCAGQCMYRYKSQKCTVVAQFLNNYFNLLHKHNAPNKIRRTLKLFAPNRTVFFS